MRFVTRYNIFKLFQMLSDSYSYRLLVIYQYIRYLSGKDLVVSKYASKWKSLRYRCANTFCNIVYLCNYCFVFVHCTFDFKHCSLTLHFCRFFLRLEIMSMLKHSGLKSYLSTSYVLNIFVWFPFMERKCLTVSDWEMDNAQVEIEACISFNIPYITF